MREKKAHKGVRCKGCGELLVSTYRHDFVRCSCGNAFADGGFDYLRYGYGEAGAELVDVEVQEDGAYRQRG